MSWLAGLGTVLILQVTGWAWSLRARDAGKADLLWGPGLALLAWVWLALSPAATPRGVLAGLLVSLWATRLTVHLSLRARGRPEDRRYAAMRAKRPETFARWSLGGVFGLQGLIQAVVALPLYAACFLGGPGVGWLDLGGTAVFAIGFSIEAIADAQLARFRARPTGEVLDTGLWRYSRHPNYLGDAVVWWGLGLIGLAAGAPWSLAGPALMTVLLRRVSGVTLLEADLLARRPAYAEYVRRTSPFLLRPPR